MFAINRTTIRETYEDETRIHTLRVDPDHLAFITEAESFLEKNSPLPVTFDVACCQNPYFSEFTYSDFSEAFWVKSLSNEFNTRYFLQLPKHLEGELRFSEKYDLALNLSETKDRKILFLAGTNLWDKHAWEIIDRLMYFNDKALIKTHPLTQDESLQELGRRYGWHRVLAPLDSGYGWYERAAEVYATANSELMVRSLLDGKFKDCLTRIKDLGSCGYMPFFVLHKEGFSAKEIKSTVLAPNSGIVFRWQSDWQDRLKQYLQDALQFRKDFIPHTPVYMGHLQ